jgi:hypothetical protein
VFQRLGWNVRALEADDCRIMASGLHKVGGRVRRRVKLYFDRAWFSRQDAGELRRHCRITRVRHFPVPSSLRFSLDFIKSATVEPGKMFMS